MSIEYTPGMGLDNPAGETYRFSVSYEESEEGNTIVDKMRPFFDEPRVSEVTSLSIGAWEQCWEVDNSAAVALLVEMADRLPNLTYLRVGEITGDECELSWIKQSDLGALWPAFPRLEYFAVHGGDGLSLGKIRHQRLKSLVVYTAGLAGKVVRQIAAAELPSLELLDIALGCAYCGGTVKIKDVEPILHRFPTLKRLGLCNSEITDDIAVAIAEAPVLDHLEYLALSEGTLSDRGGSALLASSKIRSLRELNLYWHYMSDELIDYFSTLPLDVDVEDPQEVDEEIVDGKVQYRRYVMISE